MSFSIGIDIGGTIIKIGLVERSKVVDIETTRAISVSGVNARIDEIDRVIDLLIGRNGLSKTNLRGIGIAFPGLVDVKRKKVISTNAKYDDAPDFDWSAWTMSRWNTNHYIDNDARMACVGEWQYGAGRGVNDLVMMTIGTGIGTSAVINGQLLYGKHFQAGCLGGHISIDYRGRKCTCGNTGCIEAQASTWAVAQIFDRSCKGVETVLNDCSVVDYKAINEAVALGDKVAVALLDDSIAAWSAAIVNLIHAYDPEKVVLGGGVMKSAQLILPAVRAKVASLAWTPWGSVSIEKSELGDMAAILGVTYFLNE